MTMVECRGPGFFIPIGGVELAGSGIGLPVQFVRKSVKIGGIRISDKNPSASGSNRCTGRFNRYTGPVRPVTGRLTKKTEVVENLTCVSILN
jgi:hypothetical protein